MQDNNKLVNKDSREVNKRVTKPLVIPENKNIKDEKRARQKNVKPL